METGLVLPWALNRSRTSLTVSTLLLMVPSTSTVPLPGPLTVMELSWRPVEPPALSCLLLPADGRRKIQNALL